MTTRPQFLDDLAGMAGGAVSVLSGLRAEAKAMRQARIEAMARRFDLIRREEFDAVAEMAANARAGQEAAEAELVGVRARLEATETRLARLEAKFNQGPDGPSVEV
jgi:BMFP domain-containing protein YqiC